MVEDFSLDSGKPYLELPLKNMKKSNRICFGWTVFVTSVVSGKQLLWDRGGGRGGGVRAEAVWEFSLV